MIREAKINRLILLLSLLVFYLFVGTADAAAKSKVNRVVLKNGLTALFVEESKAPVVTFQIWYKVGSRNEITSKTGLSHLLEHMMFKGTAIHGKGEFSRTVAKNGGTENAFTGNDYTAYFENFSADRIDLSLELESDRMQNLLIDPSEFSLEREVVKEERRSRTDDDPYSFLVETLHATAFMVHPYHNPIIGWMDDLNNLTRDEAYQHYKKYYQPNNATIVIVGDFQFETLLPKVVAAFEKIPNGAPMADRVPKEPPQAGERRTIVKKEAQLPFIFIGFHTPNFSHPDTYALAVLASILSSGKSSRLYQELVYKQQIALDAGGSYEDLTTDSDLFYFYGTPRPGIETHVVETALNAEIARLQTEKVTERELTKIKNKMEASYFFGADSNFARAMQIGKAETVGAGYDYVDSYLKKIRAVTADDIQRAAQTYLIADQKSVGILVPQPAQPPSPSQEKEP